MPLCIGFNDGHAVYEPLPERPPTKRQFTRPDTPPPIDLEAALSSPRWNGLSDMGLFNKLPRELRDRIYKHALVATLGELDARISELVEENGPICSLSDFQQDRGIGHFFKKLFVCYEYERRGSGCTIINDYIGLLQSNKQIHVEATKVFYSQNTFMFRISEQIAPVEKHTAKYTDWIHSRHFKHIQHVALHMQSGTPIQAPEAWAPSQYGETSQSGMMGLATIFNNLTDLVALLRARNKPLKFLRVGYYTEFLGELESVYRRDPSGNVAAPFGLFLPGSLQAFKTVKNRWNQTHVARPGPNGSVWLSRYPLMPFQEQPWIRILDPVLSLRGLLTRAEVLIRAELPQQYVQEICNELTKDAKVTYKVRQRYELQRRRREKEAALETIVQVKRSPETFECFLKRVHGTLESEECEHGLPVITPMGSDAMKCIEAFRPPEPAPEIDHAEGSFEVDNDDGDGNQDHDDGVPQPPIVISMVVNLDANGNPIPVAGMVNGNPIPVAGLPFPLPLPLPPFPFISAPSTPQ
ncbi:Niemann-Pick type C-related protein 1 [Venturia nashicola]|uniref:Niemann-Pick type C-related protein 1 n=1 Tax=Venturia nashicola TaxID=86259 RepID=A0A4Z1PG28_9PEZI|nr:Niemann-Pick type C-related protein 1 [Venturia nashicola]TLD32567.1 Niemann-Pick type C-related protein 1 [Venturia nashicola]